MSINEKGMLEKSTFGDAYRVAKVKHRDSILGEGFSPSRHFGGIDPMIGGPALIVSETRGGAGAFGDGDFGPGHYDMYKINAHGLKGASLKDNVDYNTATVARQLGRTPQALRAMHPRDVAEGALEFREAHVDASAGRVDRIRLIERGVLPRKDYGDSAWDKPW